MLFLLVFLANMDLYTVAWSSLILTYYGISLSLFQLILLLIHGILQRLPIPLRVPATHEPDECDIESLCLEPMRDIWVEVGSIGYHEQASRRRFIRRSTSESLR